MADLVEQIAVGSLEWKPAFSVISSGGRVFFIRLAKGFASLQS
ncbi:MAG: hypothetical protein ACYSWP_23620 [Planctomycetota bacterium]|jgi:hypothetical protein